ncbi:MAG: DUF2207 domain-containing protein [Bacteroidota bacterium]
MRNILYVFILFLALPLGAQREAITNFATKLEVFADGSIEVTEDITVTAAGKEIKRGITRALHRNGIGKSPDKKYFNYKVLDVQRNGASISHFSEKKGRNLILYLGSKSEQLSPGEYTFRVKYRSENQVYFMDSIAEVRWPFIGVDGALPVDKGTITISLPAGANLLNSACYTGREGSREEKCTFNQGATATTFTLSALLPPGEGMTVSVGAPRSTFRDAPASAQAAPPPPPTPLQQNGTMYLSLLGMLAALWYGYTSWRKYGVDPIGPEVRPRFSAPEQVSPAAANYLLTGFPSSQQLTASLTDLAIKGYIRIEEEERDGFLGLGSKEIFVLTLTDKTIIQAVLPGEQYVLLKRLEGIGPRIELDGEYNSDLNKATEGHNKTLKGEHTRFMKDGENNAKVWPLIGICVAAIASAAFFLGTSTKLGIFTFAALAILSVLGSLFYLWLIRKPSLAKVTLKNELKGLRQYLKLKESKRRKLLNAPPMTEAHFQELLPYAISFGLDNNWAADLTADWANTATRAERNHYHLFYLPGFTHKFGGAFAGTAYRASSGGGSGGSFSGGGGSVGGGGGVGGF